MDNRIQAFQDFLTSKSVEMSYLDFLVNFALTFALGASLAWLYVRFGQALSNRRRLANNFPMLALTTMLIITVVKSSLALSLGLVGALSIVRFRAAIKDPEELAYLFIAISIGLGLGAGQRVVTLIGFVGLGLAIYARHRVAVPQQTNRSMYLTLASDGSPRFVLADIVKTLRKTCAAVDLKRFDESSGASEAVFMVDINGFEKLEAMRKDLAQIDESMRITLLDQGVV
ncbi:MAG: DUF4956 domain-containing protein [Nannocystaceae bacterium]